MPAGPLPPTATNPDQEANTDEQADPPQPQRAIAKQAEGGAIVPDQSQVQQSRNPALADARWQVLQPPLLPPEKVIKKLKRADLESIVSYFVTNAL